MPIVRACAYRHYWTASGLKEVFRNASAGQRALSVDSHDNKRAVWAPVVDRVMGLLGGFGALHQQAAAPVWLDVGCGDGALLMTAADYGFLSNAPAEAARGGAAACGGC